MDDFDVSAARLLYHDSGFDTLPLIPGSKHAYAKAWERRSVHRLWRDVPQGVNIGIRGGGLAGVSFIDCDELRTFENITHWLAGLGYQPGDYPVVQTASGDGWHIYTTFGGSLPGDWRVLSKETGAGEFRYGPGAYVVAPPSQVDGNVYALVSGDFARLPSLILRDILPILENQEAQPKPRQPTLSRKAVALLHGKGLDGYKSRSEADQALLVSLVNAGFGFAQVLDLFNRNPCSGKYSEFKAENPKNAERWLQHSFDEAAKWARSHESVPRKTAQAAIDWANAQPWPGRTGAVDRLVFLAHLEIAHRAGRLTWAAACRDLAERAAVSHMTATRATHRLCAGGFLTIHTPATVDCANLYSLGKRLDKSLHFLTKGAFRECNDLSANAHDAFRFGGLGKSAGEVWQVLQQGPAILDELAAQTGRHPKTVKRVLERMERLADPLTGEILPMIARLDAQTYQALPVDLDQVAQVIGTAGIGEQQQAQHAKERRLHARSLSRLEDKLKKEG